MCIRDSHNLCLVPFAERFGVLRNSRYHVVQGSSLTVVVLTQFGIRMIGVIKHLELGRRDIDGFQHFVAVLVL